MSPLIDPVHDIRVSSLSHLYIVELSRDNPVELIAVLDWEVTCDGLVVLPENIICAKRDQTVHSPDPAYGREKNSATVSSG